MSDAFLKEEQLKKILKECGSAAVAFSGGVDSAYLLSVAAEVLKERCAALTAKAVSGGSGRSGSPSISSWFPA